MVNRCLPFLASQSCSTTLMSSGLRKAKASRWPESVTAKVAVTLSGQREAFAFLRPDDIKVVLQLWEARKGRHRFTITSRDLSYPPGLELEGVQPGQVLLDIELKPPEAKNNH